MKVNELKVLKRKKFRARFVPPHQDMGKPVSMGACTFYHNANVHCVILLLFYIT
jgi:hypothetical protein